MTKIKRCSHCKKDLPANTDYFGLQRAKADGLDVLCRICRRAARAAHRDKHRGGPREVRGVKRGDVWFYAGVRITVLGFSTFSSGQRALYRDEGASKTVLVTDLLKSGVRVLEGAAA